MVACGCALWGAANMIKFKIQEEDDVEEDSGLSSLHLRRAAPSRSLEPANAPKEGRFSSPELDLS